MIRERQRLLNFVNIFSDTVMVLVSFALSYFLRFFVFKNGTLSVEKTWLIYAGLIYSVCIIAFFSMFNLYAPIRNRTYLQQLESIVKADICGAVVLGLFLYFFKRVDFSRLMILFVFIISTTFISTKHFLLRCVLKTLRKKSYNQKHVLLIGSGKLAQQYFQSICDNAEFGYSIDGYISDFTNDELPNKLGGTKQAESLIERGSFDEVVIALGSKETSFLPEIIRTCQICGTRFSIIPEFTKYINTMPTVQAIGEVKLLDISYSPMDTITSRVVKRVSDFLGSTVLIILTSPIMLFAAIGTKLSSRGPVLFKQKRIGRNKKEFNMYKFRTMKVNDTEQTGWTTDNDSRKTRFGSLLRKTSIDELPQLFNVFLGEMSLIGPRPEVPFYVGKFKQDVPFYMLRHQVKPGMTGWAQVNGLRGDTSIEDRVKYDLYYIDNWSILFDLKILLKTILGGFINKEKVKIK